MCQYSLDMATRRVTFTLDQETLAQLREAAARLAVSRSAVVRVAIRDFSGRLGEEERRRLLDAFDRLVPLIPRRTAGDVAGELADLRRARRTPGRLDLAVDRSES